MVKGSMTIEAAYLVPFTVFVLMIVCYLAVFEYDKAVLKETGYECILRSMEQRQMDDGQLQEVLLERLEQTAKERVLDVNDLEVSVQFTVSGISVSFSGTQTMLKVPVEVTVVYDRIFPEQTLRLLQGI